MDAFWAVAWPVVMGFLAVGALLGIKIARRRQATRGGTFGGAVPARPLSASDARSMARRYVAAGGILAVALAALWWAAA